MTQKRLSDLDLNELFKALEEGTDDTMFRTDGVEGDVLTFLNVFNLKPGNETINIPVLRKMYNLWSKKPTSAINFSNALKELYTVQGVNLKFNESEFKVKREEWVHFYSKTPRPTQAYSDKRHFDAFISRFGITAGNTPIHVESLVLLYTRFLNEIKQRTKSLSHVKFQGLCRLYFKEIITKRGTYFYVSDNIWNSLDRDTYNDKEKDKKKQSQIPIPHSRNEPKDPSRTD